MGTKQYPYTLGNVSFSDMRNEELVNNDGKYYIFPFMLEDSPYYKFLKAFTEHMSAKIPDINNIDNIMNDEKVYALIKKNHKKYMEDFPDRDLLELVNGVADSSHHRLFPFQNILFNIPDKGYIASLSEPINVLKDHPNIHGRNIFDGRHRAIYMKYLQDLYSEKNLNRFEKAILWKIKTRYGDDFLPDNTLKVNQLNQVPNYETYPIYNPNGPRLGNTLSPLARYIENGNRTETMRERMRNARIGNIPMDGL
jgi:hypothetical protein